MVARGAMWNASIFCAKGKTPWEDVKREYVRKVFNFTVVFVRGYPVHSAWVQKHTETSMSVYQKFGVMCTFSLFFSLTFGTDIILRYNYVAEHIVGQRCEEHETYLERNDNALFLP